MALTATINRLPPALSVLLPHCRAAMRRPLRSRSDFRLHRVFRPLEVAYDFGTVTRESIEQGREHLAVQGLAAGLSTSRSCRT